MSLDEILLQKLAKWRPDTDRQTLDVADPAGGWSAAVTAECVDVVGCRLWELALRRSGQASAEDLKTARRGDLPARHRTLGAAASFGSGPRSKHRPAPQRRAGSARRGPLLLRSASRSRWVRRGAALPGAGTRRTAPPAGRLHTYARSAWQARPRSDRLIQPLSNERPTGAVVLVAGSRDGNNGPGSFHSIHGSGTIIWREGAADRP